MNKTVTISLLLRLAIFMTFIGHGMFAYNIQTSWISYLMTAGFTREASIDIMPWIGILDFIVATIILVYPLKIIVLWAFIWALSTALIRPISGEPIWAFVERASNWTVPLMLLTISNFPKKLKGWFKTC